jgi:uncharacterized protein (TIGR02246 family)
MRKTIAFVTLGALLWLGGRCQAQAARGDKEIDAVRAEWIQDLETHQLEPSLALFTDDAAFLSSDGSRKDGKEAIRGLYQQVFATYQGKIPMNPMQAVVTEYMAYESGLYRESLTTLKTGEKRDTKGSYLMVYLRKLGGKWQIAQQAWTETPAAAAADDGAGHS